MLPQVFHIKVDHQASNDSSYHTSIAFNQADAIAEFNRLKVIWPERFITVVGLTGHQPIFITSNDEELSSRFEQKRLTGSEAQVDTPTHQAITSDLKQEWLVAA
jgi:hypothetical protein